MKTFNSNTVNNERETIVKEYPILFKGDLVCAILEDRKTQTRRIPDCRNAKWQIGDRLWGRETFQYGTNGNIQYKASPETITTTWACPKWTPSIHMPHEASRILLEITAIREEKLQDITEEDAITAWNTRPAESEFLEALKGIIQADESFKKAMSNGDFINIAPLAMDTDKAREKAKQLIEKYEQKEE